MLYKYGKCVRDFLFGEEGHFHCRLVFFIFGAFSTRKLFLTRYLDYLCRSINKAQSKKCLTTVISLLIGTVLRNAAVRLFHFSLSYRRPRSLKMGKGNDRRRSFYITCKYQLIPDVTSVVQSAC